jgi:uncharacterized protein (TIGR02231 family)
MKQTFLFFLAIACISADGDLFAQQRQKLNIEEATVFLSGAELTSNAKISLTKGTNEILFTNVAGDVNSQSISVNASNGVVVESATFQNDYLGEDLISLRAREIKDSVELLGALKAQINNKITVINEQITVLQSNRKVSGDNTGLSVAELTKMLDLINSRMETYLTQKNKQEDLLKKADERLARMNSQLDEEQKRGVQPGGQILVKFYANEATTSSIVIDYVIPHGGWSPTYDIMADGLNMPVKLAYKANIYQNSGVSWNNVKLSLSTGNPNEGVQAPVMNPWYLSFYNPDMVSSTKGVYQSKRGSDVSMGGARTSGTLYIIDGVQVQGNTSINDYVTVDNGGVNTTFDIDLPYTIPSDGKQHLVAIKKYELPATYRYYAVPKLDKDAFLQAQITNWEDLNLLPGQTNIFYEGTYVGQGMVDVRNVKDTMTISLGRDKKIVVKRERDTKLRSVKTIGTNVKETFAYSITVRNTRKENINITVQDQMPVSNDAGIVLEDKDNGGAEVDETTGLMKWNIVVSPNEARKLGFGYTVKYPKGKTINGFR